MPSWKWREVRRVLVAKGFKEEPATHHEWYRFYRNGKATSIRTKISHGDKGELHSNSPLMTNVQHQLRLQRKQLEDFLNCPMSEEDYAAHQEAEGNLRS